MLIIRASFKAWSQNLDHEKVLTTFTSYGEVQPQKQPEIFKRLREPNKNDDVDLRALALAVLNQTG